MGYIFPDIPELTIYTQIYDYFFCKISIPFDSLPSFFKIFGWME